MVLSLTFLLIGFNEPDLAQVEHDRLTRAINSYNAFPAYKLLGPLSETQVESLVIEKSITEFDLAGRNFKQRCIERGFNTNRVKLDEYYYKTPIPLSDSYLLDISFVIRYNRFSHYALAIRYSEGFYYIVITLVDFTPYC
jgi:hypothetical protein